MTFEERLIALIKERADDKGRVVSFQVEWTTEEEPEPMGFWDWNAADPPLEG